MVGGSVAPPRLDLANEDLVRSHVHAIWLAETGQDLRGSLTDVLDVGGASPSLELLPEVRERSPTPAAAQRAADRVKAVLAGMTARPSQGAVVAGRLDRGRDQPGPAGVRRRLPALAGPVPARPPEFHAQSARSVDLGTAQGPRHRRPAGPGRPRPADPAQQRGVTTTSRPTSTPTATSPPRASCPAIPSPACRWPPTSPAWPGAAKGTTSSGPGSSAIGEFGPGALIYHEGARYQVVSVALPPAEPARRRGHRHARRCRDCGYLHPEAVGIDVCQHCGEPLRDTTRALLRLTSVRTARRDRISSDEEERRRAGFELQNLLPVRPTTAASPAGSTRPLPMGTGRCSQLAYGDAATVRVTNVGRRSAAEPGTMHGYMIDVTTGRWLKENEREDQAAPEEEGLEAPGDVKRKQRVIPYVEDRRNILVTRLAPRSATETAVTAAIALERGIEAAFQLEDSELSSEGLPDPERRGRALFIESAEGGAGALRRLVDDPDALPQAARTALQIMHFDPDSGADLAPTNPARAGNAASGPATTACCPTATSASTR